MRKERQGSKKPLHLATLLEEELCFFGAIPPLTLALSRAWDKAVGPRVSRRARPVKLKGSTLIVRVCNSAWMNELQMLSTSIVNQLATNWPEGSVKQLRFEVGTLPPPPFKLTPKRPQPRQAPVTEPRPLPPALSSALTTVDDDELRHVIEETFQQTARRSPDEPPKERASRR